LGKNGRRFGAKRQEEMEVRPTGLPAESFYALQSGGPRRIYKTQKCGETLQAEYAKMCRKLHRE